MDRTPARRERHEIAANTDPSSLRGPVNMRRLVFIDDDQTELDDFLRDIVGGAYDPTTVLWPNEEAKLFNGPVPDIFVSDLYLPPPSGNVIPTAAQREEAAKAAGRVAERFSRLYEDQSWDDKRRLKETMQTIVKAHDMLDLQWRALGQSPDHGIALLTKVRDRYPDVPFVFYSRKITPEDVIRVLQAGAVDAIRKGIPPGEVRARLKMAHEIYHGFNINVTAVRRT